MCNILEQGGSLKDIQSQNIMSNVTSYHVLMMQYKENVLSITLMIHITHKIMFS